MKYRIQLVRAAEKDMGGLSDPIHERVSTRILSLRDDPRPRGSKKLSGFEEYRLRVGDYRVLYVVDDEARLITVLAVGHRRDVYR